MLKGIIDIVLIEQIFSCKKNKILTRAACAAGVPEQLQGSVQACQTAPESPLWIAQGHGECEGHSGSLCGEACDLFEKERENCDKETETDSVR